MLHQPSDQAGADARIVLGVVVRRRLDRSHSSTLVPHGVAPAPARGALLPHGVDDAVAELRDRHLVDQQVPAGLVERHRQAVVRQQVAISSRLGSIHMNVPAPPDLP